MSAQTIRRKTRKEAFEHALSPEQLSQLYSWCAHGYAVASLNAQQEWGLKLSKRQLGRWYHKDDDLRILSFISTGAVMNKKITEAYTSNPAPEIETLVQLCKTLVMQLSVQGATDPEKLKAANSLLGSVLEFLKLREKEKAGDRDERRIKLLEQKADAYDRAQKALTDAKSSKGGLTEETLAKIERELKLL